MRLACRRVTVGKDAKGDAFTHSAVYNIIDLNGQLIAS